jgi:hypothetical protein
MELETPLEELESRKKEWQKSFMDIRILDKGLQGYEDLHKIS